MLSDEKIEKISAELFIPKSYLVIPKNIRLSSTYHFIMKIPSKLELE